MFVSAVQLPEVTRDLTPGDRPVGGRSLFLGAHLGIGEVGSARQKPGVPPEPALPSGIPEDCPRDLTGVERNVGAVPESDGTDDVGCAGLQALTELCETLPAGGLEE